MKQHSAGKAGERVFYAGKEEGGKESVDNPLCILLKGKENDGSRKCSALQLGYAEGAGLGSAPRGALVLGWNGLAQPQHIPVTLPTAGLSIACSGSQG